MSEKEFKRLQIEIEIFNAFYVAVDYVSTAAFLEDLHFIAFKIDVPRIEVINIFNEICKTGRIYYSQSASICRLKICV